MANPLVIVLHGPSGVGKDSVIDLLRQRTGIHRATSTTSRPPRNGEVDAEHYHFVSREEFERRIKAGEFIEWALVYGDYKGVERRKIEEPLSNGKDLIIRTDVQGARAWRQKLEGAISVFLTAEDRDTLRARLIQRQSESDESLAARVAELEAELDDIPNNDYVVTNEHGSLDAAVDELERIIAIEHANEKRGAAHIRE